MNRGKKYMITAVNGHAHMVYEIEKGLTYKEEAMLQIDINKHW